MNSFSDFPDELKTLIASYMLPSDVYTLFTRNIQTYHFFVDTIYNDRMVTLRNGLVFKTVPLVFDVSSCFICVRWLPSHRDRVLVFDLETYYFHNQNKLVETSCTSAHDCYFNRMHLIDQNLWFGNFTEDVKQIVLNFENLVREHMPAFLKLSKITQ